MMCSHIFKYARSYIIVKGDPTTTLRCPYNVWSFLEVDVSGRGCQRGRDEDRRGNGGHLRLSEALDYAIIEIKRSNGARIVSMIG